MATATEVDVALDAIAQIISEQRTVMNKAKSNAQLASDALVALTNDYADVIATVQAYGTTNAFEAASKARFNAFVTEYQALKSVADGVAAITP